MSGQITLNKDSGGQLTLAPDDNAVNKTLTVPDVGFGKVLQTSYYKQSTGVQRTLSGEGYTETNLNSNWADLGGTSSITFNKISSDSTLIIESVVHAYADQAGAANKWAVMHQRILVNGTQVATTTNSPSTDSAFGLGWNTDGTSSNGRMMGYIPLMGSVEDVAAGNVSIKIQGTSGTSNTTLISHWNYYGEGHIRVTEVAS